MGPRFIYEVRVGGVLVCRGDINRAASALGIAPSTLHQYKYDGRGPSYIDVKTAAPRYAVENADGDERIGSAVELSRYVGVNASRFHRAYAHGQRIGGYRIRKVECTEFTLPTEQIENLIYRCRVIARKARKRG